MHGQRLRSPNLDWRDGAPFDTDFGDIYFNPTDGLAEVAHVFHGGNGLPNVWADRTQFVIGELGFGTGLNFLSTWALWEAEKPVGGNLHFISFEQAPMTVEQLRQCHEAFPQLADLAQALRQQWPGGIRGFHHLNLSDDVTLTLCFGDVADLLPRLEARVDAWFLDGFAPAQNEGMWSDGLLKHISRCSRVGTTAATFTAAGPVRRGLEAAGFHVERVPGFGRKRHMTRARCEMPCIITPTPWFNPPPPRENKRIVVIGAGVAGLSVAYALSTRGKSVTLIDAREGPARGASGTPSGLVMPRIIADTDPVARFAAATFRFAADHYARQDMLPQAGGLHLATTADETNRLQYAEGSGLFGEAELTLASPNDVSEALSETCALNGLHVKKGGALTRPVQDTFALGNITTHWNTRVRALSFENDKWLLDTDDQSLGPFDAVVVANAVDATDLIPGLAASLRPNVGQMIRVSGSAPQKAVTFGNYVSPAQGGAWLGSTHELPGAELSEDEAATKILEPFSRLLPDTVKTWSQVDHWRGVRATTPDSLPIAGPVPDETAFMQDFDQLKHGTVFNPPPVPYLPGLYAFTGLGSRGLTTAPLLGEFIAAQICDEPWPLERDVADVLHPARFWVRQLIKGHQPKVD